MEVYAFGLLVLFGLIWLAIRISKGAGYKEAKLDIKEAETQTIIENRKAKYANIDMVSNLSEPERTKLRKSWQRD